METEQLIGKKVAIIVFERDFAIATKIQEAVGGEILVYDKGVFKRSFKQFDIIVAIMAMGIVVRKIAPLIKDKWESPPVVVVDNGLNFAIPLLGGHHGGNRLARRLWEKIGCLPVITTATEVKGRISVEGIAEKLKANILNKSSTKNLNVILLEEDVPVLEIRGPKIVVIDEKVSIIKKEDLDRGSIVLGIGARKNVTKEEVLEAISEALKLSGFDMRDVKEIATADIKQEEKGLLEAASYLSKKLSFVPPEEIDGVKAPSKSKAELVGLKGVAEPCALVRSSEKKLLMRKKVFGRVTVAIAR